MVGTGILALIAINAIGDWIIGPIITLNVEDWAESQDIDKLLVDGAPDSFMSPIAAFYYSYIAPGIWPYLLGFATCSLLFGLYDLHGRTAVPRVPRQRHITRSPGDLKGLEQFAKSFQTDFDLIPRGILLHVTRVLDGLDVSVSINYRNRSRHPLTLRGIKARVEIDGKVPSGKMSSGLSASLPAEKNDAIRFEPIRLFDTSNHAGIATFAVFFGDSDKTMNNAIELIYDFKFKSSLDMAVGEKTVVDAETVDTVQYYTRRLE